jgi:hypothetical protein
MGERLGIPVFHLDDYFLKGSSPLMLNKGGVTMRIFDHPSLYDGAGLVLDLPPDKDVLIEGFVAMHYQEICDVATAHIHLNVPFAKCRDRRMTADKKRKSDESWLFLDEQWHEFYQQANRTLPGTWVVGDGPFPSVVRSALDFVVMLNKDRLAELVGEVPQ